jgi:hypothetical protein
MWHRVSDCPLLPQVERFWHAGLKHDGSRCLIFADWEPLIVWDVHRRCVECIRGGSEAEPYSGDEFDLLRRNWPSILWAPGSEPPQACGWYDLSEVLEPGNFYVIAEGPGADRYRVFGIAEPGRTVDELLGLRLEIDLPARLVRVLRLTGGVEVATLTYEWSSGDFAVASFSGDGSMFAVIEPYHLTFFRP